MDDNSLQRSIHPLIAAVQIGNSLYVTALPMRRCFKLHIGRQLAELNVQFLHDLQDPEPAVTHHPMPVSGPAWGQGLEESGHRGTAVRPHPGPGCDAANVNAGLASGGLVHGGYLAGVCGGVTAVWGETLTTLLSLSSTKQNRSHFLMRAEVTNGIAGMMSSVASGYLYSVTAAGFKPGVMAMMLCRLTNVICTLYVIFFLQVSVNY